MDRPTLPRNQYTPAALQAIREFHPDILAEVIRTIEQHDVVVVGMAQNPVVKRARSCLDSAQVPFEYLEFGSYLSSWKARLAIKMWSGWPTFPQIFVHGILVGGASDLDRALTDGSFQELLAAGRLKPG